MLESGKDVTAVRMWASRLALQGPVLFFWFYVGKGGLSRSGLAWSLVLTAFYEICLFVWRFVRRVGEKSWSQIGPELEGYLVGWLVSALRDLFSRFRRKYKRRIYEEFNYFNVRGLSLLNAYTLDLTQVFVDLRIAATGLGPSGLLRALPDTPAGTSLWDFLRYQQRSDRSRKALTIVGPPGSGKTTLLQHVALIFARNRQGAHRLRSMLPILLFIRDHSSEISKSDPTLGALVESQFARAYWTLKPPRGWFERQLIRRRTVVLLDGLDEVADLETRQVISAWIDRQIANYPSARFLITARPQGYRDAPLRRADVLEVLPFKPAQVERFVRQWYAANALMASGGRRTSADVRRAQNDAADLLRRLAATPALESMTVNPLLLTMITMVHKFRGALPGSRVELYDEICEVLLGRWRQAKGIDDSLKAEQKRLALQPLAAMMMAHRIREVSTDEAVRIMTPVLDRLGVDANAKFLNYIQEVSGLLQEKEAGVWSFAHLTFQEFLASAHWLKAGPPGSWLDYVRDSWWHETIRLYAAKGDASDVVRACLADGGVGAFILASECLDEAAEMDREVRNQALQWLDTTLATGSDERRWIAAEVKLRRRIKNFQRVSGTDYSFIDPEYLTNAEYEYFVNHRSQRVLPPHHWVGRYAREDARRLPVEGVTDEDLRAFVAFVQDLDVGLSTYRLPQRIEVETVPVRSGEGGTLCAGTHGARTIAGITDLEHGRLSRVIHCLHFPDEQPLGLPDFADLSVDSDFRSFGTRYPYLRVPDEALSRTIDADVRDVVMHACQLLLDRTEFDVETIREWAIATAITIARGRRKSLFITGPLSGQLNAFTAAVTHRKFIEARALAGRLGVERTEDIRLRRLLHDLVDVALQETPEATKYFGRRAVARMVLYTYHGYETAPRGLKKHLSDDPNAGAPRALILYWVLHLINERSRGTSIPIDCVRLASMKVSSDPRRDLSA